MQNKSRKNSKLIFFAILIFLSFYTSARAAEVFYLGESQRAGAVPNPSYSLSQRFKDLLDFSSGRPYSERSGKISGSLVQELNWNRVSGNKEKSFLEGGYDYLSELNLNLQEKLWSNYNFEGKWFLRKTDNRRIEKRKDVRLKQVNLKVFNPNALFEFGDFYTEFSQFTLGSTLEGFNLDLKSGDFAQYKFIAARKEREDTATERFQRNSYGAKADFNLFRNSEAFSNFRIGLQGVTIQDDSSTSYDLGNAKDLRNTVVGIDGDFSLPKLFSMQFELSRSIYLEDEDAQAKDTRYGTAFRVQPSLNFSKLNIRYLYYYCQPKFYSELGSAALDKVQHQVSFDYRFNDKASFSFIHNYYWDNLNGSSLTKRTINDEKYIAFNLRPFDGRPNLAFRPYLNYLVRDSDDKPVNSAEARTRTAGFSLSDSLNDKTTYGFGYEYRAFLDEANRSASDYFHRLNINLGHERQIFSRRFYLSLSQGVDSRKTKTDDDKDINFTTSVSGQCDILKNLVARFGYNLLNANSARSESDYLNTSNYAEFDFRILPKSATRLVLRAERNHFWHENDTQKYRETRAIVKLVTNF